MAERRRHRKRIQVAEPLPPCPACAPSPGGSTPLRVFRVALPRRASRAGCPGRPSEGHPPRFCGLAVPLRGGGGERCRAARRLGKRPRLGRRRGSGSAASGVGQSPGWHRETGFLENFLANPQALVNTEKSWRGSAGRSVSGEMRGGRGKPGPGSPAHPWLRPPGCPRAPRFCPHGVCALNSTSQSLRFRVVNSF